MLQLGAVTEDSEGEPGGGYWRGRQGGTALPQPLAFLQVGQYVSRAEELKAIVSSSNRALLRQETSARDLLKGRPQFWLTTRSPAISSSLRGRQTPQGRCPERKRQVVPLTLTFCPHSRDGPGQAPPPSCSGSGFSCHGQGLQPVGGVQVGERESRS